MYLLELNGQALPAIKSGYRGWEGPALAGLDQWTAAARQGSVFLL
jgi:hypothetical protein